MTVMMSSGPPPLGGAVLELPGMQMGLPPTLRMEERPSDMMHGLEGAMMKLMSQVSRARLEMPRPPPMYGGPCRNDLKRLGCELDEATMCLKKNAPSLEPACASFLL